MGGKRIESLNFAIRNSLPHLKEVAAENPNAEVLVSAVKFSSGASWHVWAMPRADRAVPLG